MVKLLGDDWEVLSYIYKTKIRVRNELCFGRESDKYIRKQKSKVHSRLGFFQNKFHFLSKKISQFSRSTKQKKS